MDRLQEILEDGIIDEIYNQLKTGKEAEVWLVSHRGEPVAAKLYKSREFRSFKNDAGYREGRQVRNSRTQRAMDRGTKFGREASEDAWKSAEADALAKLHAAGVRVPRPVLFYEGVLLMEVIGDAEGRVAPRLVDAHLQLEQAQGLYTTVRGEVIKMLSADLIHGDLSEFNILLSHDGPVIIDFPQVVMAAKNSQSEHYFKKDLGNLIRFFSSIDPAIARYASDVDEIWRAYVRRDLSPTFVPSGRSFGHQRSGGGERSGAGQRPGGGERSAGGERLGGGERRGHEQRGGRGGPPSVAPRGDGARKSFAPTGAPQRRGPEVTILGQGRGGPPQGAPPPRNGQAPGNGLGPSAQASRNGQGAGQATSSGQPMRSGPPRNGQSGVAQVSSGGQTMRSAPPRNGQGAGQATSGGQTMRSGPPRRGQAANSGQGPASSSGRGDGDRRARGAQGRRPVRRF